jgi:hypothetical protein
MRALHDRDRDVETSRRPPRQKRFATDRRPARGDAPDKPTTGLLNRTGSAPRPVPARADVLTPSRGLEGNATARWTFEGRSDVAGMERNSPDRPDGTLRSEGRDGQGVHAPVLVAHGNRPRGGLRHILSAGARWTRARTIAFRAQRSGIGGGRDGIADGFPMRESALNRSTELGCDAMTAARPSGRRRETDDRQEHADGSGGVCLRSAVGRTVHGDSSR